ncbi:MAG: GNAT family N-acetyltransferase [Candidatus Hodarchaeales archaeon]|jgi:GNAT superfamily N-acetyltransferase
MEIRLIPSSNRQLVTQCVKLANEDMLENIVLLGDLFPPCMNLTDIYGVFEGEKLLSFFTVFKGFTFPSVVLLKSSKVINTFTLANLSLILPKNFIMVSSSLQEDKMKNYFRIEESSSEICMITDSKSANFLKSDSSLTHASPMDLNRIDQFYQENQTFPWNPIQLESQFYFFQEVKDTIIACGGTHFETPNLAHLGNVLVLSEYRGQSIGKKLVSTIGNEILRKKDIITLFVVQDNAPAIHLYQKLGFSARMNFTIFSCSFD